MKKSELSPGCYYSQLNGWSIRYVLEFDELGVSYLQFDAKTGRDAYESEGRCSREHFANKSVRLLSDEEAKAMKLSDAMKTRQYESRQDDNESGERSPQVTQMWRSISVPEDEWSEWQAKANGLDVSVSDWLRTMVKAAVNG